MGQKVKGYRLNAKYSDRTRLDTVKKGWIYKVNPEYQYGWDIGISGRTEGTYGKERESHRSRRNRLEEWLIKQDCVTNHIGRKSENGYNRLVVYGEYRILQSKELTTEVTERESQEKENEKWNQVTRRGLERIVRIYENQAGVKVDRKRVNRDKFRKSKKSNRRDRRKRVNGTKGRRKRGEHVVVKHITRAKTVVLTGVRNVENRLGKRVVMQRIEGIHHVAVRRERETIRKYHSLNSKNGRKQKENIIQEKSKIWTRNTNGNGYYGYRIQVKGTRNGSRRTITHIIQNGKVPYSSKEARITLSEHVAKTTVGTLGVRVEYCYC